MARTVEEIKKEMTDAFISDPEIKEKYELQDGKTFAEQFSKVSLESIWFYIVAFSVWGLEKIFDKHKTDVSAELDTRLPHRIKWYRDKALRYQHGKPLIIDSDKYDNTGLSNAQIQELETVKYCAVEERWSKLFIKVAKGVAGSRQTLSTDEQNGLTYYLKEIKDAGVLVEVVNQQADKFACTAVIFYNPMILKPADKIIETAIKEYVSNLEFNGEYSNMALTDHLQRIDGVVIPHLVTVQTQRAANDWQACGVKTVAESGYFTVNDADLNITYTPSESGTIVVTTGVGSDVHVVTNTNSQSNAG